MKYCIAFFLLAFSTSSYSQVAGTDTAAAIVHYNPDANGLRFSSTLRALRPVAGAPVPFYTYFWEFGDGHFSFEKEPLHHYSAGGTFPVRLYATNNYDDGKPPPTKPKKVTVPQSPPVKMLAQSAPAFFKSGKNVEMKTNRMPKPNEELVLVLGYRNKAEWNIPDLNGKIALLFNEKQFKQDNFVLQEARTHYNEQEISPDGFLAYQPAPKYEEDWKQKGSAVLNESLKPDQTPAQLQDKTGQFRNKVVWKLEHIRQGEERFMFISLTTTPEMLQDTNAVVTLSAIFIPDHPFAREEFYDLPLQIVASHDPNKMMLKNRRMNYRFLGKSRELSYKVRFQNTGEGPAKKVSIGVRTPQILDLSTLKVTGSQPECIPCDSAYERQSCLDTVISKDSIHFVFKNIYLPGVKQKGVSDLDSTMGFVEYKVAFSKKPKKIPFDSQASIVFDKNEPIYTNRSVGRFKAGLSPGIIAVSGSQLNRPGKTALGKRNFGFGLSLSPFAPHRRYLQWELYVNTFKESETLEDRKTGGDTLINRTFYQIDYRERRRLTKVVSIDAVPAQLRYNFNSFIGAGLGTMVSVNLSTSEHNIYQTSLTDLKSGENIISSEQSPKQKELFSQWNSSLFADVLLGMVRKGPSLGVRYLQTLNRKDQRLSMYLTWKF